MEQQPEIRWHMRPCLVDFLLEVHLTLRLRSETLYLALNIVDRYVSRRVVYARHYQLVGCCALWIASKFEDTKEQVPTLYDLVNICRSAYDETTFIQMEGHILATLQWSLGYPTPTSWLRFFTSKSETENACIRHVAQFLMELTLFRKEFLSCSPSMIALGALGLSRSICPPHVPLAGSDVLSAHVLSSYDRILSTETDSISRTLIRKYSYPFYLRASTRAIEWYLSGRRQWPPSIQRQFLR